MASRYIDTIPAGGSHLERYARKFPVVEITTSFYRHHRAETYARWAQSVPAGFRFAVKTPRELTHEGALVGGKSATRDRFFDEVDALGAKLRVLLVQLPSSLEFDATDTRRFFRALGRRKRSTTKLVCEPRHVSWAVPRAQKLFADLGIARAAVDPSRFDVDAAPGGDASLAYFRWHGSPRLYYSDYDARRLSQLQAALVESSRSSAEVWCIFDNTALGHAIGNALTVQSVVKK